MDRQQLVGGLRICIFAVRCMGVVWWLLVFKLFSLSRPKSVSNKQYLTPNLTLPLIIRRRCIHFVSVWVIAKLDLLALHIYLWSRRQMAIWTTAKQSARTNWYFYSLQEELGPNAQCKCVALGAGLWHTVSVLSKSSHLELATKAHSWKYKF